MGDALDKINHARGVLRWTDKDGKQIPGASEVDAALSEAATLITSLREALEPFALKFSDDYDSVSDLEPFRAYFTVAAIRRARTALNPKERLDALLERARSNNPSRKETGI
jgi:hypothetical protein